MKKDDYKNKINLLITYKNYLYSLQEKEEYGDVYGDTDELIRMYEDELESNKIKIIKHRKKIK